MNYNFTSHTVMPRSSFANNTGCFKKRKLTFDKDFLHLAKDLTTKFSMNISFLSTMYAFNLQMRVWVLLIS